MIPTDAERLVQVPYGYLSSKIRHFMAEDGGGFCHKLVV
jgi:hypothetical protein